MAQSLLSPPPMIKRLLPVLSIPVMTLAFLGCDSDPDDSPVQRLAFGDCPKALSGETANRTCASSSVPLRHDEPNGATLDVLVARYTAKSKPKGQLWLLDGGPGGTGMTYMNEEILPYYRQLGYDIYIPQHRGTGHSSPLSCASPKDPASCGAELVEKWGDELDAFSSSEAGYDVGLLIERARGANEKVYVLGISYGSYWAQRYLQAYPTQANGVMMDGVLPLDTGLWASDSLANEAGLRLLEACAKDATCNVALGGEPIATATRVIDKARDATTRCQGANGFDRDTLSQLFAGAMSMEIGNAIPGLLLRLDRCNADDQKQLATFQQLLMAIVASEEAVDWELDNPALGQHVLRTDLMAEIESLPLSELIAKRDEMLVWSAAISLESTQQLLTEWPIDYSPLEKTVTRAKTPVLISNGGFDVQTPLPWASNLAKANGVDAWVFPYAGHGVDISLGLATSEAMPCSLQIKAQFLANPRSKIDSSCIAELPSPDFVAQTATAKTLAMSLFGTQQLLPGFGANGDGTLDDTAERDANAGFDVRTVLAKRLRRQPRIVESLKRHPW